jgi:hypothetical protein
MSLDTKMDLMLRIKAEGSDALQHLQKMNSELHLLEFNAGSFKSAISGLFSGLASGAGTLIMKPLEMAGVAALGLGAGFAGLGVKSILAAADVEMLKIRLQAVVGSAEEANKVFEESKGLSKGTLFFSHQITEATLSLRAMGMTGKDSIKMVIDTASAMGKSLEETVGLLANPQGRGLKRFGIQAGKDGDEFTVSYKNKMGQLVTLTADSAEEARKNLASIFSEKFGGAGARVGNSFTGAVASFASAIDDATKKFGEGLLPAATAFVKQFSGQMNEYINSGKLEEMGKSVGAAVLNAVGIAVEAWDTVMDSGAPWTEKLKIIILAMAQTLATSFATYLIAYAGVFRALAHMMALSFGAELMQFPGMGGARVDTAVIGAKRLAGMGQAGMEELGDLAPGVLKDLANPEFRKYRTESQIIEDSVRNASKDEQMGLVKSIPIAGQMQTELDTATAGLGGLGDHLKGQLTGIWGQATTNTGIEGGVSGIAERGRERAAEWRSSIVVQGDLHIDADRDSDLRRDIHLMVGNPLPATGGN